LADYAGGWSPLLPLSITSQMPRIFQGREPHLSKAEKANLALKQFFDIVLWNNGAQAT
jgi:hypothetical protein